MIELYDFQYKLADDIRSAFTRGFRAPLAVSPTGSGKTHVFSYIAANAVQKGNRVLTLVHRSELLRQTSERFHQFDIPHGRISPEYTPNYRHPVQVASVQTLARRMQNYQQPNLIIVDEAHHVTAGTWKKILAHYNGAKIIGVTATPIRTDGSGLGVNAGGIFDVLIQGPTTQQLIDSGHLVQPIIYNPEKLDMAGIRTVGGDFDQRQVAERVDRPKLIGNVVNHYRKRCHGMPGIAFCVSVTHSQHVAAEFRAAGYRAYHIDGDTPASTRKSILAGLGNGQVDVVCSCDLISEGTDIPAVACLMFLRPTQSLGLFLQQAGRAMRTMPGKQYCIILDHADNVNRHGLPEWDRVWTLDGTKKQRKTYEHSVSKRIAHCPTCYAVYNAGRSCPVCGYLPSQQGPEIIQMAGELTQLTDADKLKLDKREKQREITNANSLAELEEIARRRNYKPSWALHVWKGKQERLARLKKAV